MPAGVIRKRLSNLAGLGQLFVRLELGSILKQMPDELQLMPKMIGTLKRTVTQLQSKLTVEQNVLVQDARDRISFVVVGLDQRHRWSWRAHIESCDVPFGVVVVLDWYIEWARRAINVREQFTPQLLALR
jgi:hypothetical protein